MAPLLEMSLMNFLCILFLYIVVQLICACGLRLYGNSVLFVPRIRNKKNLKGYYAIVTGSNQGIGYEVAKYLVNHGAFVVLACRNNERGKQAQETINNQLKTNAIYAGGRAEYIQCDLGKLSSTKAFIQSYKDKQYPLHLLINNAGLLQPSDKPKFSQDGIDLTWHINYLSHFLITYQLLPLMIQSNIDETFDSRIINTSSIWHKFGYLDFDTLTSDKHTQAKRYKGAKAMYGTTKLAQILHATYLQTEVLFPFNIPVSMCSVHPGGVGTNIFRTDTYSFIKKIWFFLNYPAWIWGMRNIEEGSRCTIYCAVAPVGDHSHNWGGVYCAGAYHANMKATTTIDANGQSTNPRDMKKLYQLSLDALKLKKRTKDDYKQYINGNDTIDTCEMLKDGLIVLDNERYWFYSARHSKWNAFSELHESQRCFDRPSIVMNENRLYRISGRNIKSDQCMKYGEYLRLDAGAHKWETMKGVMNERRCSASAIFLGKHLLAIGGDDNGDELASMEEYDFEAMKWNLRASMNETRNDFGVCSINDNELIAIGGHSVDVKSGISGFLDSIETYNYELDEWLVLKAKLPNGKRARCGAFHWTQYQPNMIVIAGGTSPARKIVECLDLEKMKFIQYPNLNHCHWWPQIGTLSNMTPHILYVVGQNEKNKVDVIEYLDSREHSKKWMIQNIEENSDIKKVNAMYWI